MSVFGDQNALKFVFCSGLFPGHFCLSISESKFQLLGPPNRGFRIEGIAKIGFSWKSFLVIFGDGFLAFFLMPLGLLFWFSRP